MAEGQVHTDSYAICTYPQAHSSKRTPQASHPSPRHFSYMQVIRSPHKTRLMHIACKPISTPFCASPYSPNTQSLHPPHAPTPHAPSAPVPTGSRISCEVRAQQVRGWLRVPRSSPPPLAVAAPPPLPNKVPRRPPARTGGARKELKGAVPTAASIAAGHRFPRGLRASPVPGVRRAAAARRAAGGLWPETPVWSWEKVGG